MIDVQNLLTVNVKMLKTEFRENTNSKMSADVGSKTVFLYKDMHILLMQFSPIIFLIT